MLAVAEQSTPWGLGTYREPYYLDHGKFPGYIYIYYKINKKEKKIWEMKKTKDEKSKICNHISYLSEWEKGPPKGLYDI